MSGFYNFVIKAGDTRRYYVRNTDGRFDFTGWSARMQFRRSHDGDLVLELTEGGGLTTHEDGVEIELSPAMTAAMSGGGTAELEVFSGTDNYTLIEGTWSVRPDGAYL